MSYEPEPTLGRHGRAMLREKRKRHKRIVRASFLAVVLVLAAIAYVALVPPESKESAAPSPSPDLIPSDLTLLMLRTDQPFSAIVGTGGGRPPLVMTLPNKLLTEIPGKGTATVSTAVKKSAEYGRTAISNLMGVWVPEYVDIVPSQLVRLVDSAGGLELNLPKVVKLNGRSIGPGPTELSGEQVLKYLEDSEGRERDQRWGIVLNAMFANGFRVPKGAGSDEAVARFEDAQGAAVTEFPTIVAQGGYLNDDPAVTSVTLRSTYGIDTGEPEPVILFIGVDRPNLAQEVTARIVPDGYRVVSYQTSRSLDRGVPQDLTKIYTTEDAVEQARELQDSLGVGKVFLSKQSSGLADITVIVGKNYLADIG